MAVRTNFELFDFITTGYDLSISATDINGTTQTVSSTDNTKRYFLHKYGTRFYPVLTGTNSATPEMAMVNFTEDFRCWVNNRQHNIDKLYQSMFDYEYSPIENVDRYENETINTDKVNEYGKTETLTGTDTTTYGKTDSTTYGKTDTTTYGKIDTRVIDDTVGKTGTETLTKGGSEITTTTKAGFNSPNTYTPDTKTTKGYDSFTDMTTYNTSVDTNTTDTNTLSGSDATAQTGTDRNVSSGSDSLSKSETTRHGGEDSFSDDTIRTLRVHGNIGVTSNVDLLTQEERYRLQSLADLLLDNFIDDYTYYS